MKYEYKLITTRGIDDFKDTKDRLIKMHQAKRVQENGGGVLMQADFFAKLVNNNKEGFSYIKNLAEKYGYSKLDYLNFYALQGWRVVDVKHATEEYLLEREINPDNKNIPIPDFKETDLNLESVEISFTAGQGVTLQDPNPKTVEIGYKLNKTDYPKLKPGFTAGFYIDGQKIQPQNYEFYENAVVEVRVEKIPGTTVYCH